MRSPILGDRECSWVGIHTNRKPTHDFLIPLNAKFWSICRRLAVIPMSSFAPKFDPLPFQGLEWTYRWPKMVPVKISSTHSYLTTHYRPILHRLATDTDRAMEIGGVCYIVSICDRIKIAAVQTQTQKENIKVAIRFCATVAFPPTVLFLGLSLMIPNSHRLSSERCFYHSVA